MATNQSKDSNHLAGEKQTGDDKETSEEVEAIKEICKHVESVLEKLFAKEVSAYPAEAQPEINSVKQKMQKVLGSPQATSPDCFSQKEEFKQESTSTGSGSPNGDGYSSNSGSDSSEYKDRRVKAKRKRRKKVGFPNTHASRRVQESLSQPSNMDLSATHQRLIQALERLDNRSTPRPEPFDETSGQSLPDFLRSFEEYCGSTFRGSDYMWTEELGRFLVGDIRKAYHSLRIPGEGYRDLKRKLLKWHKES